MINNEKNTRYFNAGLKHCIILISAFIFHFGCAKNIPEMELLAAKNAILDAREKKADKCASEDYTLALQEYKKAREQMKAEKYEEAKISALTAAKLAKLAANASLSRKDECEHYLRSLAENAAMLGEKAGGESDKATILEISTPLFSFPVIYFDYNQHEISERDQKLLEETGKYIKRHPEVRVTAIGHCDKRGSTEFNLALGEKRARAVKKFLVNQGVNPHRIDMVSYGEEKLLERGDSEDAHATNRRVEFKVEEY